MTSLKRLQKEVREIKERNRKVEADKAWETSPARISIIAVLTYIVIVLFFHTASLPNKFVNALVPALGFVLSTLTLSFFKRLWLKRIR